MTRSFGVFYELYLNKRLSKQPRRRWFETPSSHYDFTVMITLLSPPSFLSSLTSPFNIMAADYLLYLLMNREKLPFMMKAFRYLCHLSMVADVNFNLHYFKVIQCFNDLTIWTVHTLQTSARNVYVPHTPRHNQIPGTRVKSCYGHIIEIFWKVAFDFSFILFVWTVTTLQM